MSVEELEQQHHVLSVEITKLIVRERHLMFVDADALADAIVEYKTCLAYVEDRLLEELRKRLDFWQKDVVDDQKHIALLRRHKKWELMQEWESAAEEKMWRIKQIKSKIATLEAAQEIRV